MLEKTYSIMPLESPRALKPVERIGSTLDDLRAMPEEVQDEFG